MSGLEKVLVGIKVLFSLFISYLIIFKGDAGILVNSMGNFIISGNCMVGLILMFVIFAIYPLLLYNISFNRANLSVLKNKLLIFDTVLILINVFASIFISHKLYQMPLLYAQLKYGILIFGSTILYVLSTILVLMILRKLIYKVEINCESNINNNPIAFVGKIQRLPYFITKLLLLFFLIIPFVFKQINPQLDEMQCLIIQIMVSSIVLVVAFYAASKRLRDVQWSQWLLLVWVIPYVGLVVGIPLLFVKSKIVDSTDQ